MNKKYDLSYLDSYISGKDLSLEELKMIDYYPLKTFAYQIEGCSDFELIKKKLITLQEQVYAGWCLDEVRYILDKTDLTKRQKTQLRRMYKRGL